MINYIDIQHRKPTKSEDIHYFAGWSEDIASGENNNDILCTPQTIRFKSPVITETSAAKVLNDIGPLVDKVANGTKVTYLGRTIFSDDARTAALTIIAHLRSLTQPTACRH